MSKTFSNKGIEIFDPEFRTTNSSWKIDKDGNKYSKCGVCKEWKPRHWRYFYKDRQDPKGRLQFRGACRGCSAARGYAYARRGIQAEYVWILLKYHSKIRGFEYLGIYKNRVLATKKLKDLAKKNDPEFKINGKSKMYVIIQDYLIE